MADSRTKKRRSGLTLWICVTVAFAILIGAWATLISVASKNAPEPVPLKVAP